MKSLCVVTSKLYFLFILLMFTMMLEARSRYYHGHHHHHPHHHHRRPPFHFHHHRGHGHGHHGHHLHHHPRLHRYHRFYGSSSKLHHHHKLYHYPSTSKTKVKFIKVPYPVIHKVPIMKQVSIPLKVPIKVPLKVNVNIRTSKANPKIITVKKIHNNNRGYKDDDGNTGYDDSRSLVASSGADGHQEREHEINREFLVQMDNNNNNNGQDQSDFDDHPQHQQKQPQNRNRNQRPSEEPDSEISEASIDYEDDDDQQPPEKGSQNMGNFPNPGGSQNPESPHDRFTVGQFYRQLAENGPFPPEFQPPGPPISGSSSGSGPSSTGEEDGDDDDDPGPWNPLRSSINNKNMLGGGGGGGGFGGIVGGGAGDPEEIDSYQKDIDLTEQDRDAIEHGGIKPVDHQLNSGGHEELDGQGQQLVQSLAEGGGGGQMVMGAIRDPRSASASSPVIVTLATDSTSITTRTEGTDLGANGRSGVIPDFPV